MEINFKIRSAGIGRGQETRFKSVLDRGNIKIALEFFQRFRWAYAFLIFIFSHFLYVWFSLPSVYTHFFILLNHSLLICLNVSPSAFRFLFVHCFFQETFSKYASPLLSSYLLSLSWPLAHFILCSNKL